jgi:hypothetical protein
MSSWLADQRSRHHIRSRLDAEQIIGSYPKSKCATTRKRTRAAEEDWWQRSHRQVSHKLDPGPHVESVLAGCKSSAKMAQLLSFGEPTVSRVLAAARQQGNAHD